MGDAPLMHIDLNHLRSFVAVARTGSLTRAVDELHLSQPAISLHMRQLQDVVGLKLFHRVARGLELTSEGRSLLPLAQRALASLDDFASEAMALRNTPSGTLRVGTVLDPEFLKLSAILMQLLALHPELRPSMVHRTSGEVLKAISGRDLDIGFYVGSPDGRIFHTVSLTPLRYVVLAPAGWQRRVQGRDWKTIAELPWIWTPRDTAHHRLLAAIFEEQGVTPVKAIEVDQEAEMLELLRAGMGLALVRESVAAVESSLYGLFVATHLEATSELTLIALKERAAEPAITAAYDASLAVWKPLTTAQKSRR